MEETKPKRNLIQIVSFVLIAMLTVEVILLIQQNRDLKSTISRMTASPVEPLKPGEKVDPVKIQTLDGTVTELRYADPKKKYLLLVLSTTCPHCEKNLVNWKTITETKGGAEHCTIIGLSVHPLDETRKYAAEKHPAFYLASVNSDTSFNRKYRIPGVPETILLSGDGTVEKTWVGELSAEQTKEIQSLIGT